MALVTLVGDDIIRVKQLIREGVKLKQEVKDLQGGMRETVKAIAEEIQIPPAQLNKAIAIAFKDSLSDEKDKLDQIEYILDIVNS